MHPLADTGRLIAGRYRLAAPIGRGAMGVVWRAHDQLLDREVAVKEVRISETLSDVERANAYKRTLREAKTAGRLNHPGVVAVYDVAEDGGRPWIVMQLVDAHSLDQVLAARGPLSARRTAEIGRQLLSALSVAHAAGVMHRDVKPSNVLLGTDDRAVLTDFGIATFTGDTRLTQTGMVMGSPGFTAPERIRGSDASPASDLWSLGATLFAAVEGHGPFENRGGVITTMSAIINEDAPPATSAGALGPVIAALLCREPEDRPELAAAARMISEVLPLLPDNAAAPAADYAPTTLSAPPQVDPAAPPRMHPPAPPRMDRTMAQEPLYPSSPDVYEADPAPAAAPPSAAAAAGLAAGAGQAPVPPPPTPPTMPQPTPGEAPPYQPPPPGWARGGGVPGAPPPPDFSSWYDPAPRPGSSRSRPAPQPAPASGGAGFRPGATPQPGSGAGAWSGYAAGPDDGPDVTRRRPRLWSKIALAALALAAVAAGATTYALLGRSTPTTSTGGSSSAAAASLPPASLGINNAINDRAPSTLPSGWQAVTHPPTGSQAAGFTIAAPSDWAASASGNQVTLRDPSSAAYVQVDLTPHTFPNDMVAEARFIRDNALSQGHFPGYSQIGGLAAINVRGTRGASWKFTWDDDGVKQEVLDLLFVLPTAAGPQSYALYFTSPVSEWTPLHPTFEEEAETFTPRT
jgi:eukaryotic-like serine/threonine-protein kinase